MKRFKLIIPILSLLFVACSDNDSTPQEPVEIQLNAVEQQMATAQDDFATELFVAFYQSYSQEDNLMVSPFSLHCALGMLSNGAVGETKVEILQAMQMQDYSQDELNAYFHKMVTGLPFVNPKIEVQTTNSVWYNQAISLKDNFVNINKEQYAAEVASFDASDADGTAERINNWCSETTQGKIPSIISPGEINESSLFFLLNSLYFKGRWASVFSEKETYPAYFHYAEGDSARIPFMHQRFDRHAYAQNELFGTIALNYLDGSYAMRLILPHEGVAMDEVVAALKQPGYLASCVQQSQSTQVNLAMPRFRFDDEYNLISTLKTLGMELAFDSENADLTDLTARNAFVTLVRQSVKIEVNEEGSEAAAVTIVGGDLMSPGPAPEKVDFTLNRPFLFLITENGTGTVLFMGKVGRPEE